MATYRVYLLTPAGHFLSARDLECEDDTEAVKRSVAIGHPHTVEIWRGVHLVARMGPQPEARLR